MMKKDHAVIPWPTYWQLNMAPSGAGCLSVGLSFVLCVLAPIVLAARHINPARLGSLTRMGGFIACAFAFYLLFCMVLTLVNMIIRAVWWCRVGRLTTWKKIGNIVLGQTSEYEILVKPIFTGITSFGTYDIEGGWPAFILRKKENGDLWAVIGKIPKDFEEYQIDCVRV